MSEESRGGGARGATTLVSAPALRQASKPVFSSRRGSGALSGGPGLGENEDLSAAQYGCTLKPYSDWTPRPGTTGLIGGVSAPAAKFPEVSLSSATTASTRESTPCTYDTAAAPSECPMMATRSVRPGVTV